MPNILIKYISLSLHTLQLVIWIILWTNAGNLTLEICALLLLCKITAMNLNLLMGTVLWATPCNWTYSYQPTKTKQTTKLLRQQTDGQLTEIGISKPTPRSVTKIQVVHEGVFTITFLLLTSLEEVMKGTGTGFHSITWHHLPILSFQYS